MGVLRKSRHELFAQHIAKGRTADEAYVLAGYAKNRGNAATLRKNKSVQFRIEELQERGARRVEVSIETLTRELDDVKEKALNNGNYAAAISAIMGMAKLNGRIIDQVATVDLTSLTNAELENLAAIQRRLEGTWDRGRITPAGGPGEAADSGNGP